jgi:aspartyl-tRNA(Asn)/glutamyl-tRNA(Gln) amidotransferase subunit A
MTGNVGLKTSIGRWSTDGIVPLSPTLDTAGVLARSVRDVAYGFVAIDPDWGGDWDLFTAQHGDLSAHDLKIGVITDGLWDDCDDGVGETVEQALEELQRQGATLTDIALPEAAAAIDLLRRGSVAAAECDEFLSAELPDWRDMLDPVVSARIRDGGSISAVDYLGRRRQLRVLARTAAGRFGNCDVLACPTVAVTPPKIDEVTDVDGYRPRNLASLRNTCVANFLGLCAITLPVGLDRAGLPVGLQLFARHCGEAQLLAVGLAAERSLGTPAQRLGQPPLGAPRSGMESAA